MPRHERLDVPGALHQVSCRGIERQPIVREDSDRVVCDPRRGRVVRRRGRPVTPGPCSPTTCTSCSAVTTDAVATVQSAF